MRWNTKESEEGGEETKMMMVNRGEWEELVKILRDVKEEIKGWRKDMKEMRGCLEKIRRWTREKAEVVKESKGKVCGEEEHAKEEKKRQRGNQETKKELIRDRAEREEKKMEGKEGVGGRGSD